MTSFKFTQLPRILDGIEADALDIDMILLQFVDEPVDVVLDGSVG